MPSKAFADFAAITAIALTATLLALPVAADAASRPVALPFDAPGRTTWRPEGCRSVPAVNDIIGTHGFWRMLHSDIAASDEVSIAFAPVFEPGWHTENSTFHVTVPVFDQDGNLYAIPYLPHENIALVSLKSSDGSRRWAIPGTGAPVGACAPISLDDPDNAGQSIIYVTLKDRAFAVRQNGTIVWDVPTGLALSGVNSLDSTSGNSYLPQRDAIVGLTTGGELYLVDRVTGAQLLAEPFSMPGEPSPVGPGIALPPDLVTQVEADLGQFINFPPGSTFQGFLAAILGNGIEVSNSFSIDANSGRMWIAATAPDSADGTVDGVSDLGSLYALDVVDGIGGPEIQIACRRDFVGGSASTPAIRSDGTRVYVGDNSGNVLAIDEDCNEVWSTAVGSQVTGSIAVASDNDEIYASTQTDIVKIVDTGATGAIAWTADLEVYDPNGDERENFNTLLAGIGANGVNFMAGVGIPPGVLGNLGLPMKVGYGVLDRETGKVRYFSDGLDESVAEMNAGPDGAYYNGNSPIRRAFSLGLFGLSLTEPLEGGIRQFLPTRVDLLVRDAVCAAADRAVNALANAGSCAASVAADSVQIGDLLAQSERSGAVAVTRGDLTPVLWNRIAELVADAQTATLADQATILPRACAILSPCDAEPRTDCRTSANSKISMKTKTGADPNVDKLSWSWTKGQGFTTEIGDPTTDADYGLCVYSDADGTPRLLFEGIVPASSDWETKTNAASWKGDLGVGRTPSQLSLKGGDDDRTSLKAKISHVGWPFGTFLVARPLVIQAVNVDNDACWSSRFESSNVVKSTPEQFKASVKQ